jgi:N-acetylglutamate synthase-like GNAT family acetyltransferase
MFHVKNMSPADFEFAVNITDQMGWGLAKQDFQFMLELEPEGSFVLLEDSERIGIATTVSFGKVGWFGNLVVNQSKRNRGAGSLLVEHATKYLTAKHVETIGLYAYMERIPFYKRLGFECNSEFIVLKGKSFSSETENNVKKTAKRNLQRIIAFDGLCFGASRKKLLEPILLDPDNLCCEYVEDGEIWGYGAAKVYGAMAELGPLVFKKDGAEGAVGLLRAILSELRGLEISMFLPKEETQILSTLKKHGFRETFKVETMFYGPPIERNCIYMAESLERG